jgi:competence protein ComEC
MLREPARAWTIRPLACAALGLSLGLWLGAALPTGCDGAWALASALTAMAAAGLALWRSRRSAPAWALLVAGLGLGLWRVQGLAQTLAAPLWADRPAVRVTGILASDDGPRPLSQRQLYVLEAATVQALRPAGARAQAWPNRIRVSLGLDQAAALALLPGDRISVVGDLRAVEGPSNPGEFDYRAYLAGRGISASFSARPGWPCLRLQSGAWTQPRRWAARSRAWMEAGLAAGLQGRALDLGQAMVLGDKGALSREDLEAYSRSGLVDLFTVSGLHFALALALFLFFARLFTPDRRRQAAVGLALGILYASATGFEPPVQRAFALFALWLLGRLFDLDTDVANSLAAGCLAILLLQPGALWEAGFQLSFVIALSVCCLGPALSRGLPQAWPRGLRRSLGALAAIQWALMPLLAAQFHQCSWPALFSSLVSGALTLAVLALGLPLSALGAAGPWLGPVLGWPLTWVLRGVDAISAAGAALPGSAYSTGPIPAWLLAAFLSWAVLAIFARGRFKAPLLGLAAAGLAMALLWGGLPWAHRHPGLTRMWCLDIGQGDSTLLEFGDGRTLLVDGGPLGAGSWVVVPALRALGIQRLTWAVATHADADHIGGLAWVLEQFPVDELLWNGQAVVSGAWIALQDQAQLSHVPLRILGSAIPHQPQDGPWAVLNPSPAKRKGRPAKKPDTNGASLVLRVEDWLLLTGDFPKKGEARLVEEGLKPVQVLKVGHHGSRGSTSAAFVQALHPQAATISCGRHNRYGHPSAEALGALAGVPLWRTDQQGCLSLEHFEDGRLSVRTWWPGDPARLREPRRRLASAWQGLAPDNKRDDEGSPADDP